MIRLTDSGVHAREIEEVLHPGDPGFWVHPEWESDFPWLVQGTTGRGRQKGETTRNFARFTDPPAKRVRYSWEALGTRLDFPRIAHSRQVHGNKVSVYEWSPSAVKPNRQGGERQGRVNRGLETSHPGPSQEGPSLKEGPPPQEGRMILGPDADGHLTSSPGVLLAVTVADCVPVFLVDPTARVVGVLHAGWRGTVVGVLDRGIEMLNAEFGSQPGDLHVHLGPAICGECYEVGPEVHTAMGLPDPGDARPIDIRSHLAAAAVGVGIEESRLTQSAWCTLCGDSPFFSHRRGDAARQVGFLGIRLLETALEKSGVS
jgi:YfiH family protein